MANEPRTGQTVVYKGPQNPDQAAIVTAVNKDDSGKIESINLVAFDGGSWIPVDNVKYSKSEFNGYRNVEDDFGDDVEPAAEPSPVERPGSGAPDQTIQQQSNETTAQPGVQSTTQNGDNSPQV